jgi:UDP-glucose 4-epimerase
MRYVITGGSGYIGSRLVDLLSRREDTERIVICDLTPPRIYKPKTQFEHVDVRDRKRMHAVIEGRQPDALVHLAFIFHPIHDEELMYDVDVNGTHNVLESAAQAGTPQVLVITSVAAYGAHPDNPVPLTEDDPVRGVAGFSYARDKTESDRICQLWAAQHPDRIMTIVRPCIVFGPNVDNYILRLWTKQPFVADIGTVDNEYQFVHEDDVVEAVSRLLLGRHDGAFNVAGEGVMTARECAELLGMPIRKMPLRAWRALATVMWRLRASESPPGSIDFSLYPWVVSNEKLKRTLDWTPRYTSRETFEITMRANGKLPSAGAPSAGQTPSAASAKEPAASATP